MDMQCTGPGCTRQKEYFSSTSIQGTPLLVDLAELQRCGHDTLKAYIDYCFTEESPRRFVLPVADTYLYPMQLIIKAAQEGLSSFWQSPFCRHTCQRSSLSHPCVSTREEVVDCDLFCFGSSDGEEDTFDGEEGTSATLNLMPHFSCHTNSQGSLSSCGILAIKLFYQQRDKPVLTSVELTIGCDPQHTGVLVIQGHSGLVFSLK